MKKTKQFSEAFEIGLSQILSGEETIEIILARFPEFADELRPELEAVLWLYERRDAAKMRPGYLTASRNRLVEQIKQEELKSSFIKKLMWDWKQVVFRLAFVTIFFVVCGLAFAGGEHAIHASLPGDRLYDVKLATENVQISLASKASTEAELRLEFADIRAQEAASLLERGRYEDATVALHEYQRNLLEATDLIQELDDQKSIKAELAQKLAASVTEHNESFAVFVTAGEIPGETISILSSTLAINDEISQTIVVILEEFDEITLPVQASITPSITNTTTPTPTSTSTSTSTPTALRKPSETFEPSATLKTVDTDTPKPSETPEASQTPVPVKPTDDAADEPEPTKKPTKTPKPKKPTKTPKEKKPTKTPKDK